MPVISYTLSYDLKIEFIKCSDGYIGQINELDSGQIIHLSGEEVENLLKAVDFFKHYTEQYG